jgi:hypothetical protein
VTIEGETRGATVRAFFSDPCIQTPIASVLQAGTQWCGPETQAFEDEYIMKKTTLLAACALSLFAAAAVQAQPVVRDGVLADAAGRTVYTFDKDEPGKSNCSGGCLVAWPPFTAKPEAAAKGEAMPNPVTAWVTARAACGM